MTQWFALLGCLSRNVWSVLILALIMMVALTRSQCSRLEDICTDPFIGRQRLLVNGKLRGRIPISCNGQEWFHSPDGRLNSSSLQRGSNNLEINVINASGSDEGAYGCITSGRKDVKQCIYVYSRLEFASCPEACVENVTASNGNVSLNATLHYIPGGSCGFQQSITDVILRNLTSRPGKNIFRNMTGYGAGQVSLRRSGLEIVLTLMNVHQSGSYKVIIERSNPAGHGSHIPLEKTFHINIQRACGTHTECVHPSPTPSHSTTDLSSSSATAFTSTAVAVLSESVVTSSRPTHPAIDGTAKPSLLLIISLVTVSVVVATIFVVTSAVIVTVIVGRKVLNSKTDSHPNKQPTTVDQSTSLSSTRSESEAEVLRIVQSRRITSPECERETQVEPEPQKGYVLPPPNDRISRISDVISLSSAVLVSDACLV